MPCVWLSTPDFYKGDSMLKEIHIQNFQSHVNSKIKLNKHVNVISGLSDSGKSAIIRLIRCILLRETYYLTHGSAKGKSTLIFDDCEISREFISTKVKKCPSCKDPIERYEQVCENCGHIIGVKTSSDITTIDTVEYTKFGRDMPEEIKEKTKIYPVKFVNELVNINMSAQFDDMFFIGNSYNGSMRNKMISGLIPDVDIIDKEIKLMNSEKHQLNTENSISKKQIEKIDAVLELIGSDMTDVDKLNEDIEKLKSDIETYETELEAMKSLKVYFDKSESLQKIKSFMDAGVDRLSKATTALHTIEHTNTKHIMLINILRDINLLNILNADVPEQLNVPESMITDVSDITDMIFTLNDISDDIGRLTLIGQKIPTVTFSKIYTSINNLDNLTIDNAKFKLYKKTIENAKVELTNTESLVIGNKNQQILLKETFKKDNPKAFCPITKDIYHDECLKKINKP